MAAYGRWVTRHPAWILALCALLVAVAGAGVGRLEVIADYTYHFGDDNPELAAFRALQETYTKSDNVLFVVVPTEGDVFSAEALAAISWLTERAWQLPYAIRVDSLTNFQHTRAQGDELVVADLVEGTSQLGAEDRERIRRIALRDPALVGRLVGPGGGAAGVNVTVQLPDGGGAEPQIAARARALASEWQRAHPGLEIALTGVVILSQAMEEAARDDGRTLVPLMFLAIVLAMWWFLRSAWGTLATSLLVLGSAASAMGLAGWIGIPITPPSASAPTLILSIAVADSIHILVGFTRELWAGASRRDAIAESLRVNWQPVLLTTVTTAVGFLCLLASDVPSYADLGLITALGVAVAWVLSVSFLPAFVVLVPYAAPSRQRAGGRRVERFAEWVIARRDAVLVASIAVVAGSALCIPRIELDDSFLAWFDPSTEFRKASDLASERLSGMYLLHHSLSSGEAQGVSDPSYLEVLEAFATWLRAQPEVDHVSSLSDTMRRLNQNMHADDAAFYRIPERRELAAQYLLLYEMSLPYGLDLNNRVDIDKRASQVVTTLANLSSRELRAFDARASRWLETHAPATMRTSGTGTALMFANLSLRNVESMLGGTALAVLLIAGVLMLALRSVRLGALSLIPNLAPTAIAFGVWGLWIGSVGLAVAIVTAASLGVIVDGTVHFLSKYLRARRERGASSEDAVRYALDTVGSALWVAFLILLCGFAVLSLSTFQANAHFGLLVSITIVAALLGDFLLLPALLMGIERRRERAAPGALAVLSERIE